MNNNEILKTKDDQIIELIVKNDTLCEENEELRNRIDKAINCINNYEIKIIQEHKIPLTNDILLKFNDDFKRKILLILDGKEVEDD